jgi:hypothetical protein
VWLERHFGNAFEDVIFCNLYTSKEHAQRITKGQVCRGMIGLRHIALYLDSCVYFAPFDGNSSLAEIGAIALIEDSVAYCKEIRDHFPEVGGMVTRVCLGITVVSRLARLHVCLHERCA